MSSIKIHSYKVNNSTRNIPFSTEFNIENARQSLVNSLRRSLISLVPTVAFDDTWIDDEKLRPIVCRKNTSALHNEWLAQRISLCPIRMTNNNELKIQTSFNNLIGRRVYNFKNPDLVPIFTLNVKNDKKNSDFDGNLWVTTNDFKVQTQSGDKQHQTTRFLPLDPFTNKPIIVNLLKPGTLNAQGEEIDIVCHPQIGNGHLHARHNPTGSVAYEFVVEQNKDVIDKVFEDRIKFINKERKRNNLEEVSKEEREAERRSFELLDKARIFKKNPDGTPKEIHLEVETVGSIEPSQIVFDGLKILELSIQDILSSIYIQKEPNIKFTTNEEKVKVLDIQGSSFGVYINLIDETHTIGYLLGDYSKKLFAIGGENDHIGVEKPIFTKVAYDMSHPLEPHVYVAYDFETVDEKERVRLVKIASDFLSKLYGTDVTKQIDEMEKMDLVRMVSVLAFMRACNEVKNDIIALQKEWSKLSNITSPTFEILDKEHLTKNILPIKL
jgi:DNA-directed RNA polymerase alpha subunit/DNA-directed RNA polymerase subunit L